MSALASIPKTPIAYSTPFTRPSVRAWVWDCQFPVPSLRLTAAGSGRPTTRALGQPFSLACRRMAKADAPSEGQPASGHRLRLGRLIIVRLWVAAPSTRAWGVSHYRAVVGLTWDAPRQGFLASTGLAAKKPITTEQTIPDRCPS